MPWLEQNQICHIWFQNKSEYSPGTTFFFLSNITQITFFCYKDQLFFFFNYYSVSIIINFGLARVSSKLKNTDVVINFGLAIAIFVWQVDTATQNDLLARSSFLNITNPNSIIDHFNTRYYFTNHPIFTHFYIFITLPYHP